MDAGENWQTVIPPGVTECTGGSFDRASDPWLSFAPNGDLHLMHLVLDITPPPGRPGGFGDNGMMVQKVPAARVDRSLPRSDHGERPAGRDQRPTGGVRSDPARRRYAGTDFGLRCCWSR